MTYLLDVNILIALLDGDHVAHGAAHTWFERTGSIAWASCPLTQNGVVRIIGHPRYPNSTGSPAAAIEALAPLLALPGHEFWPNDISLMTSSLIDPAHILTAAQVTDSYLLALAAARGGQLATLDRRLSPRAVRGGGDALCLIPARG